MRRGAGVWEGVGGGAGGEDVITNTTLELVQLFALGVFWMFLNPSQKVCCRNIVHIYQKHDLKL